MTAFDESQPLPAGTLAALAYINRKDVAIEEIAHAALLALDSAAHLEQLAARSPFRCPRCGSPGWVPAPPHRGLNAARCISCMTVYDAEEAARV